MTGHSTHSPSKAHRYIECPGSINAEAAVPDPEPTPESIDGTHSHKLLETLLRSDNKYDPNNILGVMLTDEHGNFIVDSERLDRVMLAYNYVINAASDYRMTCKNVEISSEEKVNPEYLVGNPNQAGTSDVRILADDTLEIIDYKDGFVPVNDIYQNELYGIGHLAKYKLPTNVEYPVKKIKLTIIQPKMILLGRNPIKSRELTTAELLDRVGFYSLTYHHTLAEDAPRIPGDTQCRYCKVNGNCEAQTKELQKELGVLFSDVTASQQVANKDPGQLTDEELVHIYELSPLATGFFKAAENELQNRLKSGKHIPGVKMVKGNYSRKWLLPDDEMEARLRKSGIPKSHVYTSKLISPNQAQNLVWEDKSGKKKRLTKRQFTLLENQYIKKTEGEPVLALESDERQAVEMSAASLFSDTTNQVSTALPDWLK